MSVATELLLFGGDAALPVAAGGWAWRGPEALRVLQLFRWPNSDIGLSVSNVFSGSNRSEIYNLTQRRVVYADNAETRIGAAPEPATGMVCFGGEWGNNRALFLGPNGELEYGAEMKNWGISAVTYRDRCYVSSNQRSAGAPAKFTDRPSLTDARSGETSYPFGARTLINHMVVHNDQIFATGIFGEYKTACLDGRSWDGDALMLASWRGRLWCTTGARQVSIPGNAADDARIMMLDEATGWLHVATLPAKQGSSIVVDEANDRLLVTTFPQQAIYALSPAGIVTLIHSNPQNTSPANPDRSFGSYALPGVVAYTGPDRAYVYGI